MAGTKGIKKSIALQAYMEAGKFMEFDEVHWDMYRAMKR